MQPECKTGQRDVLCEPSLYLMQVAWLLGPCVHCHEKLLSKGENYHPKSVPSRIRRREKLVLAQN